MLNPFAMYSTCEHRCSIRSLVTALVNSDGQCDRYLQHLRTSTRCLIRSLFTALANIGSMLNPFAIYSTCEHRCSSRSLLAALVKSTRGVQRSGPRVINYRYRQHLRTSIRCLIRSLFTALANIDAQSNRHWQHLSTTMLNAIAIYSTCDHRFDA